MKIVETHLPGVVIIEPKVFGDRRGYFLESYQQQRYTEAGIDVPFVQDNMSHSSRGVLRGMHFQLNFPQGKLVSVSRGEVFDVALDVRQGSPTFGQWFGALLNDKNHHQLYVPPGYAHGFCVLSEIVDFQYKCTDLYHPEDEGGILWNDPEIGIEWPIKEVILSDKDKTNKPLSEMANAELPVFAKS